jgi:hypothetical protein
LDAEWLAATRFTAQECHNFIAVAGQRMIRASLHAIALCACVFTGRMFPSERHGSADAVSPVNSNRRYAKDSTLLIQVEKWDPNIFSDIK